MGSSETEKPAKEPKTPPPPSAQEPSSSTSTATVNAEWSGFQAYSPIPPHGFLASSPQVHPYVWGVQHVMPPYGTPPHPYMAMYPHGGLYTHPSIPPGSYPFIPFAMPSTNGMAEAPGNTPGGADAGNKPSEGKEKLPIKRSKGSLGSLNMITGKNNEEGKTTGPSANGACSKSAESESDGTSEGSDENSHNDSPMKSGEAPEADVHQNGSSGHVTQNGVLNVPHTMVNHAMAVVPLTAPGAPAPVPGPATNLNIGMDYWGAPASSTSPAMRGKVPAGSRDNLQSQLWLQDERELKRQRRKQSNRESARRSRLRKQARALMIIIPVICLRFFCYKQEIMSLPPLIYLLFCGTVKAECDELAQRADSLKDENAYLRSEINRIRSEYEQLVAENASLKERVGEAPEELGPSRTELRGATRNPENGKTDQVHSSL